MAYEVPPLPYKTTTSLRAQHQCADEHVAP